jgi:prephenate dehydrogenase
VDFIGGHPMAGAASSGGAAARADLFDSRPWFLVPHGAPAGARNAVEAFVRRLGAQPIVLADDGAEHDRVMAAVSHLPQVVASALMLIASGAAGEKLAWAGNGLRDTTRLAQSSGTVWQSILDTNASEVKPLLEALARELDGVASRLGDGHSAGEFLDRARRARELL